MKAAVTITIAVATAFLAIISLSCTRRAQYGMASRVETAPYLHMPSRAEGDIPKLLSQTGAFSDTGRLIPSPGLIPYDLIVPFWSDGADKSRLIAVPKGTIDFAPTGEWRFPAGTVFVKTFELSTGSGAKRRLETRLLVRDAAGGVYGAVYKWRADGSDADLLDAAQTETISVRSATGESLDQQWYFPSRKDCLECHTAKAGGVLGVKTRQMNRVFSYPSGIADNQLRAWSHIGLFAAQPKDQDLPNLATLAAADDESRSLQDRARSYLDANCAQCHRPGGTVANFDARYDTPLAEQGLINGAVLIDQGIDRPRVISPHDIWRSIAYMRINTVSDIKMPPLARETVDQRGVRLLNEWIDSLPGRPVLAPPTMLPHGGSFAVPVEISLAAPAGVDIRYTLDGSEPGASDMRYDKPIKITHPTILRVRAYKDGFTRSVVDQAVFIVGKP